eukprot:1176431-Prorocentrum_minimum.AAC.1
MAHHAPKCALQQLVLVGVDGPPPSRPTKQIVGEHIWGRDGPSTPTKQPLGEHIWGRGGPSTPTKQIVGEHIWGRGGPSTPTKQFVGEHIWGCGGPSTPTKQFVGEHIWGRGGPSTPTKTVCGRAHLRARWAVYIYQTVCGRAHLGAYLESACPHREHLLEGGRPPEASGHPEGFSELCETFQVHLVLGAVLRLPALRHLNQSQHECQSDTPIGLHLKKQLPMEHRNNRSAETHSGTVVQNVRLDGEGTSVRTGGAGITNDRVGWNNE